MSTNDSNLTAAVAQAPDREQELQHIREALQGLRYGAVHIIVQDGVVIQIERTEKHRLRRTEGK